jgi:hypothetical protein
MILSRKQWKDRLSKWGFLRNLTLTAAAVILSLLREADDEGILREVCYNHHTKSLQDIRKYIAKSTIVQTEEALLEHLPPRNDWPQRVTWKDGRTAEPANHSVIQDGFVAQAAAFGGAYVLQPSNAEASVSTGDHNFQPVTEANPHFATNTSLYNGDFYPAPFHQFGHHPHLPMASAPPYQSLHRSRQVAPRETWNNAAVVNQNILEPPFRPELEVNSLDEDESFSETEDDPEELPMSPEHEFDNFYEPLVFGQSHQTPTTSPLANINPVMSATPLLFAGSSSTSLQERSTGIETYVTQILGNASDLHKQPAKLFVNSYLRAMAYTGQGMQGHCEAAIQEAGAAFQDLTASTFVATLPSLNLMSFIFEVYGHKHLKERLLRHLGSSTRLQDDRKRTVIFGSLRYLLDTVNWSSDMIDENKARSDSIYKAAVDICGVQSELAVAARFNQAWLLLEADETKKALAILNDERSRCETACGILALQTICWIATQARAHLKNGEPLTAESLMYEVVLTRAKRAFSEHHAIYWEVMGRIGLFLMKFAMEKYIPDRTQEFWDNGERLLRDTLLWRGQHLGPPNPQTQKIFRLLKRYLEHQEKNMDAENLWNWYSAATSQI